MKPRILHIDNSPGVTGAYKALLSYCREDDRFEHIWVLPSGSAVVPELRNEFRVYELPFAEIGRSPLRLLQYLPMLWRNGSRLQHIIRTEQPALLHINDLYNLAPYVARRSRSLPIAVHARMLQRSFPAPVYRFWKAWHLKRAQAVIAVSEAIRKDWDGDARIAVIYDPVQVRERLPAYQFRPPAAKPFRFVYLANYIDGKGQDDALRAVRLLKEQGVSGFRVDFYGGNLGLEKNDAYRAALEAEAAAQRLDDLVQFNGPVTDVEATLKGYQAALHFSRAESFGMVCYEALWYGLPVISSDCGGPAEMMIPGETGVLLPVGDITAYAAAMAAWIRDPSQCAPLPERSRAFVRGRFEDGTVQLSVLFTSLIPSA